MLSSHRAETANWIRSVAESVVAAQAAKAAEAMRNQRDDAVLALSRKTQEAHALEQEGDALRAKLADCMRHTANLVSAVAALDETFQVQMFAGIPVEMRRS